MKNIAIIQARMGSSRMPGKVLRNLVGKPVLWHIIYRLKKAHTIDGIVVATTLKEEDDPIIKFAEEQNINVFRGSENNVLDRFYSAAEFYNPNIVLRVTGDVPLIDPETVDLLINELIRTKSDYCVIDPSEPCIHEGFSPFTFNALKKLKFEAGNDPVAVEHVTAYFKKHPDFVKTTYVNTNIYHKFSGARISVDTPADFYFIEELYSKTGSKPGDINIRDVVNLLNSDPKILAINSHVYQKKADDKTKTILFRCDGNHKTGLGHVYRCIALANELRDRYGYGITFAMQTGKAGFDIVSETGFELIQNYEDLPENEWFDTIVSVINPDCIVLDTRNALSTKLLRNCRDNGIYIITIDDPTEKRLQSDLAFYPPVPQVDEMDWSGFNGKLFTGWEWVILRKEFTKAFIQHKNDETLNILVSTGGSDPSDITIKTINSLKKLDINFKATIILGPAYSNHNELINILKTVNFNYEIINCPSCMAELMTTADLAIASYGVTAYELAALGIPSILISLTDDHFKSASVFEEKKMAINLGISTNLSNTDISQQITKLLIDPHERQLLSRNCKNKVDGLGSLRIATEINKLF